MISLRANENHGYRARESTSHLLYETNLWIEQYVKNATLKASA